jgi:hypothetical protein
MVIDNLADSILEEIRSRQRELQLANDRENSSRSREVYKEEKKEIQNYTSLHEDVDVKGVEVSARPASWPEAIASYPVASTPSSSPLAGTSSPGRDTMCQERGVSNLAQRELSSRYSGISVQHVRTAKGVKIAITLQKPEWTADGVVMQATAELKTYDRMREIKSREQDSEQFAQYLKNCKQDLQDTKTTNACIGRLHERGKRSAWLYDTLILAFFQENKMSQVMLYLEGEEHIIPLDLELTDTQQKFYLAQGRYGNISSGHRAPRLDDLPLVKFGG